MNRAGALELCIAPPSSLPNYGWSRAAGASTVRSCCASRIATIVDFVYGPTHEEVITDIARREPAQLQAASGQFLIRFNSNSAMRFAPRFGVMRAREFIMKDAYFISHGRSEPGRRAIGSCTTPTRAIFYPNGAQIQGRAGRWRQASAATPRRNFTSWPTPARDAIAISDGRRLRVQSGNRSHLGPGRRPAAPAAQPLTKVPTPNARTIAEVSALLGVKSRAMRQDPAGGGQRR